MRERLPHRRASVTDCIRWPETFGRRIHVTAGFTNDGRILETFVRGGGRVGSERDFLLDDIAVLISRLLQHGDDTSSIANGLGRIEGRPSSVIGGVVDLLIEIEKA